jgi:hypothetical protein
MKLRVHETLNRDFKITFAHELNLKPKEAIGYYNHVVAIGEIHV